MEKLNKLFGIVIVGAVIGSFSMIVLLKGLNFGVPSRDSGAFLYGGRELLLGKIPYKDFWDHKPPLIYYINAAAVVMGPNNLWGLWTIEWVFLLATLVVLLKIFVKNYGKPAALASMALLGIVIWPLLEGGNRVEEYGLLFQVLALAFFGEKKYLTMGLVGAGLFLLRPNMIMILIAAWIYFMFEGWRQNDFKGAAKNIGLSLLGFLIPVVTVGIFYLIKGGVQELWDEVFYFNFLYSKSENIILTQEELNKLPDNHR